MLSGGAAAPQSKHLNISEHPPLRNELRSSCKYDRRNPSIPPRILGMTDYYKKMYVFCCKSGKMYYL